MRCYRRSVSSSTPWRRSGSWPQCCSASCSSRAAAALQRHCLVSLPVIVAFQALLADKQRYYVDAGVVAILLLQPQRWSQVRCRGVRRHPPPRRRRVSRRVHIRTGCFRGRHEFMTMLLTRARDMPEPIEQPTGGSSSS
jgi:hypothetical protein